jgi:hypothetical protein
MSKTLVVYEFGLKIPPHEVERWMEFPPEIKENSEPKEDGIALYREDKKIDWSWPDEIILLGNVVPIEGATITRHIQATNDYIAELVDILNEIFGGEPDVDDEVE